MISRSVSLAARAAILWCALASAQTVFAAEAPRPQGQAIEFGIGSFLNLQQFSGATIAYQRSVSDDVTWRLGMTIDLGYTSVEHSETGTGEAEVDASVDLKEWSHRVSAASEWLVWRGSPVSVYFGGGPWFSYTTSQSEDAWFGVGDDEGVYHSRQRASALSAGAVGVLGVQWAPSDWCGLHAEYRLTAAYVRREQDRWTDDTIDATYSHHRDETWNGFAVDNEGVRAGASVYF
jgi:hypothetical protein